jgi:DNA-binding transcriptional LysR family regulator
MAVRVTASNLANLVDIPLGVSRHALYASPGYIARQGAPERLEELSRHPLLHFGSARRARWDFREDGKPRVLEFHPALNSNNGPFLLDAARTGLGIARLPDFIVGDAARAGTLVPVLPQCEIAEWGIHLVYSANRRINKRMRVLIEALQERCSDLRN